MKFNALIFATILVILSPQCVKAWPTRLFSDAEIVEQAELIVLARVKIGSMKKIFHDHKPGMSYEHSAILIVSHVIKGEFHETELPIMIHYGLLPIASDYFAAHHIAGEENFYSWPESL